MERPRNPGQRAGLTRAAVLAAARDLLADGEEALSMRALARRLGVAPNALYSHVASRTALVDDLLDDVLAEVEAPTPDVADPGAGLHALMAASYDVLLAHPTLVPLYLARQGARGPHATALGDTMSALLGRCGVHGPAAAEAVRVLVVHTIGFAAFATRPPGEPGADGPLTAAELRENFLHGLQWLLVGIVGAAGPQPASRDSRSTASSSTSRRLQNVNRTSDRPDSGSPASAS